jgi:hypothetical protein
MASRSYTGYPLAINENDDVAESLFHSGSLGDFATMPAAQHDMTGFPGLGARPKKRTAPDEPKTREGPEPTGGGGYSNMFRSYGDRRSATSCCTARRTVASETWSVRAAARWLTPFASICRAFRRR